MASAEPFVHHLAIFALIQAELVGRQLETVGPLTGRQTSNKGQDKHWHAPERLINLVDCAAPTQLTVTFSAVRQSSKTWLP